MNSRITYQIKFLGVEFLLLPFYPEVTNRSNQTCNILFQITLCFKKFFLTNCQKFCVLILYNKICKFSEKWEKVASLALYSCTASAADTAHLYRREGWECAPLTLRGPHQPRHPFAVCMYVCFIFFTSLTFTSVGDYSPYIVSFLKYALNIGKHIHLDVP